MEMVTLNSNVISYTISKNINNNMSISIENGEIKIKAPWYLKKEKVNEIIEEKGKLILEKIKEYQNLMVKQNKAVQLLGNYYYLQIQYANICAPQLELKEKYIEIILPNKYKKADKETLLKRLIDKMYKVVAEKEIEQAMERTRKKLGFAPEDYEIKTIKNYLGKCTNDKIIIINPEIVKFNKNIIDYIVLHEFCHLKHKNHSRSFFNMLSEYEHNYKEYEKEILEFHF